MDSIRVLLVDDHMLVRQGVKALLAREPDIQVVGEASDGPEAVRLAKQCRPHVVVMDAQLPGLSGIEATRAIRQACSGVEILALTMHDNSHTVLSMLKAGARGYLLKESAGADLGQAVRSVSRGQSVLHPSVARIVVEQVSHAEFSQTGDDVLTLREREIFEYIAAGKTSREIAAQLGLSAKTVDNFRASILHKLQARNKAEAIAIGVQRGLIRIATI